MHYHILTYILTYTYTYTYPYINIYIYIYIDRQTDLHMCIYIYTCEAFHKWVDLQIIHFNGCFHVFPIDHPALGDPLGCPCRESSHHLCTLGVNAFGPG